MLEPLRLRFGAPSLAPVFDAALRPGDTFVDIGANIGVYAMWAARLVGDRGRVFAFEPVPGTRAQLERNVVENGFSQVEVVPKGVGAEPSTLTLHVVPGSSGLSSRYARDDAASVAVEVEVATLDAFFAGRAAPRAMKIDVEGMELDVLRGAAGLLASPTPPAIVFEAHAPHFDRAGTTYASILAYLRDAGGYRVFALGPRGVCAESVDAVRPGSGDVLAVRTGWGPHDELLARLSRVRFQL
ncbi:MAG: FkbM family methyltransferase [Myxococcota bacterium]|nr:FkbM family methyltransferase [Myxococcales bacterium]